MISPGSLVEISVEYIKQNLVQQCLEEDPRKKGQLLRDKSYTLRNGVDLPRELWDLLLHSQKRVEADQMALLVGLTNSWTIHSIQKLYLRNASELTDEILERLLSNNPVELDIHNCPLLTQNSFNAINTHGKNLKSLVIGSSVQILPSDIAQPTLNANIRQEASPGNSSWGTLMEKVKILCSLAPFRKPPSGSPEVSEVKESYVAGLQTPNLKKLVIWGHHVQQRQDDPEQTSVQVDYWQILTEQFIENLECLDLSYCQEFMDFSFMEPARHSLRRLILHDVLMPGDPASGWNIVQRMHHLRLLDVSQSLELAAVYNQPDILLEQILNSLPHLEALDISGTNLAGHHRGGWEVSGLRSRLSRPLEFLGLLGSHYKVHRRPNIPAKLIASSLNEQHLLLSMKRYMERPDMLKRAFRMLYGKLMIGNDFDYIQSCLHLTLDALEIHVDDKHVLLPGLCVLFNLIKRIKTAPQVIPEVKLCYTSKIRKRIISATMKATSGHGYDLTLLRNCFLVLCLMDLTTDLVPVIHDLMHVLLFGMELALTNTDLFLLRTAIYLLKPVVGLASVETKKQLGVRANAVMRLCEIISSLIEKEYHDHLSTCWIALEYLTDEIAENCDQFMQSDGLELFIKLKTNMPTNGVLTPALGVLTNVAIIPKHRPAFMKQGYISHIFQLMKRQGEIYAGYEQYRRLSYAAAGCMCFLISEPSFWDFESPTKIEILEKLGELVSRWDIGLSMGIELNTLNPILDVLQSSEYNCRAYAAWTLANLIYIEPSKYIPMIADPNHFLVTWDKALNSKEDSLGLFTKIKAYETQQAVTRFHGL